MPRWVSASFYREIPASLPLAPFHTWIFLNVWCDPVGTRCLFKLWKALTIFIRLLRGKRKDKIERGFAGEALENLESQVVSRSLRSLSGLYLPWWVAPGFGERLLGPQQVLRNTRSWNLGTVLELEGAREIIWYRTSVYERKQVRRLSQLAQNLQETVLFAFCDLGQVFSGF